jgi:hypothetical protein
VSLGQASKVDLSAMGYCLFREAMETIISQLVAWNLSHTFSKARAVMTL